MAAPVGMSPVCDRVNSTRPPKAACNIDMCRPTVGWVNSRARPRGGEASPAQNREK